MSASITKAELPAFLAQKPYSVLHIDGTWDGYRKIVTDKIDSLESQFQNEVSFAYIDCDKEQDFAREIGAFQLARKLSLMVRPH